DYPTGDDQVGVGGGDADAGSGADQQARVALEEHAAGGEVDQLDLGAADDAGADRAERRRGVTRVRPALLARRTLDDALVQLHVISHHITRFRGSSGALAPRCDPKIGTLG